MEQSNHVFKHLTGRWADTTCNGHKRAQDEVEGDSIY